MSPHRRLGLSSIHSVSMVMLVALLTVAVGAQKAASTVDANAPAQVDTTRQIFLVGDGTPASCTKDAIQFELWAALAAGGGNVFFNCGPDPVTIPISTGDPLTFFDNTTIDGSGRITLQARLDGLSLEVDGGATVLMKNLTIVSSLNTTGVLNKGNLTVWECTFSGSGGAILSGGDWGGSSLNIIQSTFSNSGPGQNTAVTILSGTGSVRRSTFSNTAGGLGGAIEILARPGRGTLDIANSRFLGNLGEGAGAIYNEGVLTIENSEFAGNHAVNSAGAIGNVGSLTVTNTTFANNLTHGPSGGAITGNGTIVIRNCDFLNNRAYWGGALDVSGQVTVLDSTFSGNSAVQGGAIYTSADPLTIRRSIVITNTAFNDGGGIFVAGGSLVQHRDTIIDNFPNDIIFAAPSISTAAPTGTVDPTRRNK